MSTCISESDSVDEKIQLGFEHVFGLLLSVCLSVRYALLHTSAVSSGSH
jgi:hypothetical protein